MKSQIILVLSVFCALTSVIIAQEKGEIIFSNNSAFLNADKLIKGDLFSHSDQISKLSLELTESQKLQAAIRNRKDIVIPFVLNSFVGFGVGSFVQQDNFGGILGLTCDVTGIVGIASGVFVWILGTYYYNIARIQYTSYGDQTNIYKSYDSNGIHFSDDHFIRAVSNAMYTSAEYNQYSLLTSFTMPLVITGAVLLVGSKIFQMIRPVVFAEDYNKKLGESLGVLIAYDIGVKKKYVNHNLEDVYSLNISFKY
ncbi:MAG: P13 family porin [Spirochaetes bacterium]|nr:P13 family porin [Spirochaetota bacterium]